MTWTVVIPTMWRSPLTIPLLKSLAASTLVNEVIIIDNSPRDRPPFQFPKIQILEQSENIYVNPAWNLGIQHANNELICLCNDDVTFSPSIFISAQGHLETSTVIGCHQNNFSLPDDHTPTIHPGHSIGQGWGCVIFLKKKSFIPIPETLKIWCGDDWLVITHSHTKRLSFPVRTVMSTTSGSPGLNNLAKEDKRKFIKACSKLSRIRLELLHFSKGAKYSWFRQLLLKTGFLNKWNLITGRLRSI